MNSSACGSRRRPHEPRAQPTGPANGRRRPSLTRGVGQKKDLKTSLTRLTWLTMKTIQVDESVYSALEKRVTSFGETPNDVLRRILDLKATAIAPSAPQHIQDPLLLLVQSADFERMTAKDKYLTIYSRLYTQNKEKFERLEGFSRGSRIHISKDKSKIENSGNSTMPESILSTPFFVVTNLDNRTKREMLIDVLRKLDYPIDIAKKVAASIPDSGITRGRRFDATDY
jgi:negative regulator of replication initiation